MPGTIIDQTIDFYNVLFDYIFSQPFLPKIKERLKRNAVKRQVEEAADAASQSLTRFFLNQQVSEPQVADIFSGFSSLKDLLKLEDIANPNDTPESVVELLLVQIPCPESVQCSGNDAVYRVALHSVVQVLMQIGSVMAEWEKVNFSTTFELPQRVVNRLNAISKQLDAIGKAGQDAADYNYEITYRDYLLQRFNRVEAGTVRMTTNMDVDLRELFVMPRVHVRPALKKDECDLLAFECDLMDLTQARRIFESILGVDHKDDSERKEDNSVTSLEQVLKYPRNVIVGAPGSGKSTFLEWLQIMLASVEQELIMGDQQAIPLLLRVRQMDIQKLPANGAEMIGLATASNDWAALMPYSWLERQMQEGRVFFMLDGLDETEPDMRDKFVIPWFYDLFRKYPDCHYLISSRPAGYPSGMLLPLQFTECDLLDFNNDDIAEYTCHWCTAVRLAQNELETEARKEGKTDGEQIFEGFKNHPYICNLARNPLMLSAICLVNYFEGGTLPQDRALLYELCVEGLLHNWDQRRGIHSPFRLDEKLRACREVALAMQAEDRAEIEAETVEDIFSKVLNDSARAKNLLQHIRHRTGLLIERRAGIFAFAHLTFQEYLAACAVYEGNQIGINAEQLVNEHDDARWKEVIALYCGIVPAPIAHAVIEQLIAHNDTKALSSVLADAYLSAGQELFQDCIFRQKVLERIAVSPGNNKNYALSRFPDEEVAPIVNKLVGQISSNLGFSESVFWLAIHQEDLDESQLSECLKRWENMKPIQLTELMFLSHLHASDDFLAEMSKYMGIYKTDANIPFAFGNTTVTEVALFGFIFRKDIKTPGVDLAFLQILRKLSKDKDFPGISKYHEAFNSFLIRYVKNVFPQNVENWAEFASLSRILGERLAELKSENLKESIDLLNSWADSLESELAKSTRI